MTICRITARLFADNTNIRNKFTFSKVVKRLNSTPRKKLGIDGVENLPRIEDQLIDPNLRDDINPDSPPAGEAA